MDVHNKSERPQNPRIQEQLGHDMFVLCRVKWNFRLLFSSAFVYRDERWGEGKEEGGLAYCFFIQKQQVGEWVLLSSIFYGLELLPFLSYMNYIIFHFLLDFISKRNLQNSIKPNISSAYGFYQLLSCISLHHIPSSIEE